VSDALADAAVLAPHVDAVQIAENPRTGAGVAPLALASLLIRDGIDPLPHMSCRDRNRIALQSDLLGLRALGVGSLLLVDGDPPAEAGRTAAKEVFDITCQELVATARDLNEEAWPDAGHEFIIGTRAESNAHDPGSTAGALKAHAAAGARFLQTRPCFDLDWLRRFVETLVQSRLTWNCAIIVTLAVLPSAARARQLVADRPGTLIPDALIRRLETSPDPLRESIGICAGLMRDTATIPGVSGFNLLVLDDPAAVVSAIRESGLRTES